MKVVHQLGSHIKKKKTLQTTFYYYYLKTTFYLQDKCLLYYIFIELFYDSLYIYAKLFFPITLNK